MMDIRLIDELRETRRRLAEQCGGDVQRYAAMLQELSRIIPGAYAKQPLLPGAVVGLPRRRRYITRSVYPCFPEER